MVSKNQKAAVMPKRSSEAIRQSRRSVWVGESKFHTATWITGKISVLDRRHSRAPHRFVEILSFVMRRIGYYVGITGISMNG